MKFSILKKTFTFLVIFLCGCSQNFLFEGRKFVGEGQYDKAIESLYKEIDRHPESPDAWRELGIAYYKKGNLTKAETNLKESNRILPDAKTFLYLGLIYEYKKSFDQAIDAYRSSLNLNPGGKTKSLLLSRVDGLLFKQMKQEVNKRIADTIDMKISFIPENSIAVVDFDGSLLNPDIRAIARGLAEFTSIDLAKVKSLRVMERLKLQLLLEELKLSASIYTDQSVAPRLGKLLGSQRLVTGSLYSIGEDKINLNGMIVDVIDTSVNLTNPQENKLKKFFDIQKKFVFQILDELGIKLTTEERDAIKEVPTESLLAFLAYCQGLEYQHQGMYDKAADKFEEAVEVDQNFSEAATKAVASANIESVLSPENTIEQFEITAVTEITQESPVPVPTPTTPVAGISNIVIGSLAIPDHTSTEGNDPPVNEPPQTTATIVIQGDLDGN